LWVIIRWYRHTFSSTKLATKQNVSIKINVTKWEEVMEECETKNLHNIPTYNTGTFPYKEKQKREL
jgi:hypothetical protein